MRGYTAPPAGRLKRLLAGSIGSKIAMAVTGLAMFGFLVGHLSGNLLVFSGRDAVNDYAAWLREHPMLLWGARIVLLGALALHVATGLRLARANREARPVPYTREDTIKATLSSRTMVLSGLLVLLYVAYHLLHFTFQVIDTGGMGVTDAQGRADVYGMVVAGFRDPLVSIIYVLAQGVLLLHLWHAVGSMCQTLGLNHEAWNRPLRAAVLGVPALLVAGYVAIPVAVWTGVVQ